MTQPIVKSFRFGNQDIFPNVFLSPMSGVSDMAFRLLCKRLAQGDTGLLVSEFVSIEGIARRNPRDLAMMEFAQEEKPFCMQIFGGDPIKMAEAALVSQEKGADFVEINCGCPVPKVVKKGGGSALLKDVKQLQNIIAQVRKTVSIPLSIKVRTGWDEEQINVSETGKIAQEEGSDLFIIHGRTRTQGYRGLADWELIGKVKNELSIPVIGNGDISTVADAVEKINAYGVDGVSIGRGALHNPWVFDQVAKYWRGEEWAFPTENEQKKLFQTYSELLKQQGMNEIRVLGRLKQMGARLMKCLPDSTESRRLMLRSQDETSFIENLNGYYKNREGQDCLFRPDLVENLNGESTTIIEDGKQFKK